MQGGLQEGGKGQPPLLHTAHHREATIAPLPGFQAQLLADLTIFIFFFSPPPFSSCRLEAAW